MSLSALTWWQKEVVTGTDKVRQGCIPKEKNAVSTICSVTKFEH